MKRILPLLTLLSCAGLHCQAASAVVGFNGVYTQNFDEMGPTGLDLPDGWRVGPSSNVNSAKVAIATNGNYSVFAIANYGNTDSANRSLGSLASPQIGGDQAYQVTLANETGSVIDRLNVRYTGRQWRVNGNPNLQQIRLQFSRDGQTFNDTEASFLFSSPIITGNQALDGALPTNSVQNIGGIINADISPGEVFAFRWIDRNDGGNDHILAIDDVRVELPDLPPTSVITSFTPAELNTGDLITIQGRGFRALPPKDYCAIVALPNGAVPLRILSAEDDRLVAQVGLVPPGGGTGPIMIAPGNGEIGTFEPLNRDIVVRDPSKVFTTRQNATLSQQSVRLLGSLPSQRTRWFVSEPENQGELRLVIDGRFRVNANFNISGSLRINDPATGLKDIDFDFPCVIYQPGGNAMQAAQRICDAILSGVKQLAGLTLNCTPTRGADGRVTLVLSYPGGSIGQLSSLTVCVTQPVLPIPTITSVSPAIVKRGEVLTIKGSNFGARAADICALLGRNGQLQPVRVLSAQDDEVTVQMEAIAAKNAGPGWKVMLVRGIGGYASAARDGDLPGWAFAGEGDPAVGQSPVELDPANPPAEPFSDSEGPTPCADGGSGGVVSIPLPVVDCVEGTILKLDGHWDIKDCEGIVTHVDAWLPAITYHTADGSCADVIKAALDLRFNRSNITSDGFPISTWITTDASGNPVLNIACDSPNAECPCCIVSSFVRVIFCPAAEGAGADSQVDRSQPGEAKGGEEITIDGKNLGDDADKLCVIQRGPNGVITPLRALRATGNQLIARLAAVPKGAETGPIMVMRGTGVRGPQIPVIFPDLIVGRDGWFFRGEGRPLVGGSLSPLSGLLLGQAPCITGEMVDGKYCLYITNACPANTVLDIQADFTLKRPASDLAVDMALNGTVYTTGGSPLDCAQRICDLVACGLASKLGVKLECVPTRVTDNLAKVTLADPSGAPFETAYLSVCFKVPPVEEAPIIEAVEPARAGPGDIVNIRGKGWGLDPQRLCIVVAEGPDDCGRLIPLKAIAINGDILQAEMGPVPADVRPGRLMIARGDFNLRPAALPFEDVRFMGEYWGWAKRGPAAVAAQLFEPVPRLAAEKPCLTSTWDAQARELCLILKGNWAPSTILTIIARAHDTAGNGGDLIANDVVFLAGGSLLDRAQRLGAILEAEFVRQSGVAVGVRIEQISQDEVRLCIFGTRNRLCSAWLSLCLEENRLRWERDNLKYRLIWPGKWPLEHSTKVEGPYEVMKNATSPLEIQGSFPTNRFFRTRIRD